MTPATNNAAPTSTLTPEFESFMNSHTKTPSVMAATEINNSRACALTIRTRGGFNGMVVYLRFIGGRYGYITRIVLLQPLLLELLNIPFTRRSRGSRTPPGNRLWYQNHLDLPVMSTRTFLLNRSTGPRSSARKIFSLSSPHRFVYALEFFAAHEPEVLFFLRSSLTKMVHAPRTTRYLDSWSRHCVFRWTVRPWTRRTSKDGRRLRLFDGRRKQFR
jgi:hypothetical protein